MYFLIYAHAYQCHAYGEHEIDFPMVIYDIYINENSLKEMLYSFFFILHSHKNYINMSKIN